MWWHSVYGTASLPWEQTINQSTKEVSHLLRELRRLFWLRKSTTTMHANYYTTEVSWSCLCYLAMTPHLFERITVYAITVFPPSPTFLLLTSNIVSSLVGSSGTWAAQLRDVTSAFTFSLCTELLSSMSTSTTSPATQAQASRTGAHLIPTPNLWFTIFVPCP